MSTDLKWSEVPVGEVFSRRCALKARWIKFLLNGDEEPVYQLLVDHNGEPCGLTEPVTTPLPTKDDGDWFLTGEKLRVAYEVIASKSEPNRIALKIEKAEPDLKVPLDFEYDDGVFLTLFDDLIEKAKREPAVFDDSASHANLRDLCKQMFDAGIAHAAKVAAEDDSSEADDESERVYQGLFRYLLAIVEEAGEHLKYQRKALAEKLLDSGVRNVLSEAPEVDSEYERGRKSGYEEGYQDRMAAEAGGENGSSKIDVNFRWADAPIQLPHSIPPIALEVLRADMEKRERREKFIDRFIDLLQNDDSEWPKPKKLLGQLRDHLES